MFLYITIIVKVANVILGQRGIIYYGSFMFIGGGGALLMMIHLVLFQRRVHDFGREGGGAGSNFE